MKKSKKTFFHKVTNSFGILSRVISHFAGSPWVFTSALLLVIIWLCLGPIFGYSDSWQLFVNTLTTIVTFLMVFLIQNSQNRDFESLELKLDEIISNGTESKKYINIEELSEEDFAKLKKKFGKK